ncbi:MAG: hypothetical protein QOK23_4261 [Gammaproteobacteria bacterium]|nr:hypothetical protein [Gammaproteobacteria bacterium]
MQGQVTAAATALRRPRQPPPRRCVSATQPRYLLQVRPSRNAIPGRGFSLVARYCHIFRNAWDDDKQGDFIEDQPA